MRAAQMILLLVLAAISSGCTDDGAGLRYRIDGAVSDLCIPPDLDIQAPHWVPGNMKSEGIAIRGCGRFAHLRNNENCVLPSNVISIGVGPKAEAVPSLLSQFSLTAHIRKVAESADSEVHLSGNGRFRIARVKRTSANEFYVWKRHRESGSSADLTSNEYDELVFDCGFDCNRRFLGDDLRVSYTVDLVDTENLPDVELLDIIIKEQIDLYRCAGSK